MTIIQDESATIKSISVSLGAGGPPTRLDEDKLFASDAKDKARYKIEVMFSRHRSSRAHKPSPCMVLVWESGKRFHGGGDEKMYWCGYSDCGMPFPSSDFGYMHVVCRHCRKEQFLDNDSRAAHGRSLAAENKSSKELMRMPIVVGEKLANLLPAKLAELLVKTWHMLDGDADVYMKYSPYEIRYDAKHETVQDLNRLDKVRANREPVIYTLGAIRKDLASGTDLKARFLSLITA